MDNTGDNKVNNVNDDDGQDTIEQVLWHKPFMPSEPKTSLLGTKRAFMVMRGTFLLD